MAWFDYLGGLAQGVGGATEAGLQLRENERQRQRQQKLDKVADEREQRETERYKRQVLEQNRNDAMVELGLRESSGTPLTETDVEQFTRQGLPKAMFVKKGPGLYGLNKTVAQRAADMEAQQKLSEQEAARELEDPQFASRPLRERLLLARRARRTAADVVQSPEELKEALRYDPEFVSRTLQQEAAIRGQVAVARTQAGGRAESTPVAAALVNAYLNPPTAVDDQIVALQRELAQTQLPSNKKLLSDQLAALRAEQGRLQGAARQAMRSIDPRLGQATMPTPEAPAPSPSPAPSGFRIRSIR
jgi:hypothetical protein